MNIKKIFRPRENGVDHPLTDAALELIAGRFKVLSEPMRLKLIAALKKGEKNVTELVEATGGQQANISRHLNTLVAAGILSRRKSGLKVYYAIADQTIFDLCEHVCGSIQQRLTRQAQVVMNLG